MILGINIEDFIFITIVLLLILTSIVTLLTISYKEKYMDTLNKAKKDMIDLEAITKNLEDNYRPQVIELTNYEREQEESAVISYEELLKKKSSNVVNYDTSFVNDGAVEVKKVDLRENIEKEETYIPSQKIEVNLFDYEKEEAFLKALKQLQSDLLR
jgi:hypothetical protein